jgi:hypothetical protein
MMAERVPDDRRCFTYCGDERCTCDARVVEDGSPFAAAVVLGNRSPIPEGEYWLVECHPPEGQPGNPLYWMDDYDSGGRTGFDYIPQRAACFRTRAEAVTAWAARGVQWEHKPRVLFIQHAWSDA